MKKRGKGKQATVWASINAMAERMRGRNGGGQIDNHELQ